MAFARHHQSSVMCCRTERRSTSAGHRARLSGLGNLLFFKTAAGRGCRLVGVAGDWPAGMAFRGQQAGNPRHAGLNQGCGMRKCATTVRTRITGTAKTTLRDILPSQPFARGRSSSPTMTVASSAKSVPALISDARTGNKCGGHIAGRRTAHPQPGRTGCTIQRTSKPKRTTEAATTGERVAPCVGMGMLPDYRSGTQLHDDANAGPAKGKIPRLNADTSFGRGRG